MGFQKKGWLSCANAKRAGYPGVKSRCEEIFKCAEGCKQLNSLCGDIQTIKLSLLALSVGALIDYTTHQEVGRVAK